MGDPSGARRVTIDSADGLDRAAGRSPHRTISVATGLRLFLPVLPAITSRFAGLPGPRAGSPSDGGRSLATLSVLRHLSARPRAASQRPRRTVRLHRVWRSGTDGRPRTAWRLFPLRCPSGQLRSGACRQPSHVGRQDQPGDVRGQRAQDQCGAERDQSGDGYRHHRSRQARFDAGGEGPSRRRSPCGDSWPTVRSRASDGW